MEAVRKNPREIVPMDDAEDESLLRGKKAVHVSWHAIHSGQERTAIPLLHAKYANGAGAAKTLSRPPVFRRARVLLHHSVKVQRCAAPRRVRTTR